MFRPSMRMLACQCEYSHCQYECLHCQCEHSHVNVKIHIVKYKCSHHQIAKHLKNINKDKIIHKKF